MTNSMNYIFDLLKKLIPEMKNEPVPKCKCTECGETNLIGGNPGPAASQYFNRTMAEVTLDPADFMLLENEPGQWGKDGRILPRFKRRAKSEPVCEDCEIEGRQVTETTCPYMEDIHGEETPAILCDDCYKGRCMEI